MTKLYVTILQKHVKIELQKYIHTYLIFIEKICRFVQTRLIIEYIGEKKKKEDVCFPILKRHGGQQCEEYYGRNGYQIMVILKVLVGL